jgi:ketosteroid isomerase-like protein
MSDELATIERFVKALGACDLDAIMARYEQDAVLEAHIPPGDGHEQGIRRIAHLMETWYTGRTDTFEISHRLINQGSTVALSCELHWREEEDGEPLLCVSNQSHFFEVSGSRIQRHWLCCSGVRAYSLADEPAVASASKAAGWG